MAEAFRPPMTFDPSDLPTSVTFVTIEEAQARLTELIDSLEHGAVLAITRDGKTIARLTSIKPPKVVPHFGSGKGTLVIVSDDDEHLKDFEEYMP